MKTTIRITKGKIIKSQWSKDSKVVTILPLNKKDTKLKYLCYALDISHIPINNYKEVNN